MHICGEIIGGARIRQYFVADAAYFNGLSLLIATYQAAARSSHLELELSEVFPESGLRASKRIGLNVIYDNSPIEIFMPPDADSRGKLYRLDIWSDDAVHDNAATLYLTPGERRIAGHVRCEAVGVRERDDGIIAELSYAPPTSEWSVPPNLEISLVSQCNFNCVHCISRDTRKVANHMPDGLRAAMTNWAAEGKLRTAYTDFSGDVFWADSRFGGALDFFIGLDIPFHIDTNGSHVSQAALDRLFASKVTSINVSIDAAEPETYRAIRKGSPPLAKIFGNMALIRQVRADTARHDVRLSAAFVMMKSNIAELPKFIRMVAAAGFDDVRTIHVQAHDTAMIGESLFFHQGTFNTVRALALAEAEATGINLFIDRAFESHADHEATSLCRMPWNAAYVLANGDVLACCIPGLKMGNLHEQPMEQIWNGPAYRELRRTVNSDERPAACRACPFNRKTNNPLSYTPVLSQ